MKELIELVRFRIDEFSTTDTQDHITDGDIEKSLKLSLSAFNAIPPFTYFTFEDEENIVQFSDMLVTYACYMLLIKISLAEKKKESDDKNSDHNYSNTAYNLSVDLYNNWLTQVTRLKESDSFYSDFIAEE
jgi:Ca2+/Na+ antiporter